MVFRTHPGVSISLPVLLGLRAHATQLEGLRKRVMQTGGGPYRSTLRGRGIDFAETRLYQPGDDARHIDWRVTARSGRLHTKRYEEERERPVFLIVDYNASMFFATRVAYKSVIAAQIAALLAWSAAAKGDRVGGMIFAGDQQIEVALKKGQQGVLPLLNHLADVQQPFNLQASLNTLSAVLTRVSRVARPGSLIFLISDFYEWNTEVEQRLGQLAQYADIQAAWVFDPLEKEPPPSNVYTVSDGDQRYAMDTSSVGFCNDYRTRFLAHESRIGDILRQYRIPLLRFATDQPVAAALLQQLG